MKKPNPHATLPNISSFCETFESGSFTKAANALGLTPQAVSRAVARLEASLGVTLFRRTTRQLHPTDQGRAYYEACKQALSTLSTAEESLSRRHKLISGRVRISAPTTYGHHRLLPTFGELRRELPLVDMEVHISNRNIDFVREGYDLAIRMGEHDDATLIARRLEEFTVGVFASPAYLKERGTPASIEELDQHQCIVFLMPSTGRPQPWVFLPHTRQYTPRLAYQVSEDVLGLITMARAGVGLIQTYHFLVERELSEGSLIEVLAPQSGFTRRFSLLYPKGVIQTKAVRAVIDFIVKKASKVCV